MPYKRRKHGSSKRRSSIASIAKAVETRLRWPKRQFARAYIRRPSTTGPDYTDTFGDSYKLANFAQREARDAIGYTGRGMYTGRGAYSIGRNFRKFGQSNVGRAMSNRLAGYIGSGAYESTSNNLVSGVGASGPSPAMFSHSGDETGAITISHREYITDVFGPTTSFNVQSFSLNPGLQGTFPWLSQLAQNYDEYEFRQLLFTYRSTVSDAGNTNTGQVGTVLMATNYKASARAFTDKQQMVEYAHASSGKAIDDQVHGVECDPSKSALSTDLYVRTAPLDAAEDLKTYDKGLFQFAVANSPPDFANQTLGELWVQYTVTLRKPKLFTSRGKGIDVDQFLTSTSGSALARSPTPFGSLPTAGERAELYHSEKNSIGCQMLIGADGATRLTGVVEGTGTSGDMTIRFPAGYTSAVKIEFVITTTQVIATQPLQAPQLEATGGGIFGNFIAMNDIYDQEGTPTNRVVSPNVAVGAGPGADVNSEYHFFVSQSTGGVENVLIFDIPTGGGTNIVFSTCTITQYNTQGLTTAADRLVWRDQNNALISKP